MQELNNSGVNTPITSDLEKTVDIPVSTFIPPTVTTILPAATTTPSTTPQSTTTPAFYTRTADHPYSYIGELSEAMEKEFDGYTVWALEKLQGSFLSFSVDGSGKMLMKSQWASITTKDPFYKDYFNALMQYRKGLASLVKSFSGIPFTIYGEIIGGSFTEEINYFTDPDKIEIRWFDFYVNENYLNVDDFNAVCSRNGLQVAPLFFFDTFDKVKLEEMANGSSKVSDHGSLLEGLIIRPYIEDSSSNRRIIAKLTNLAFKKKDSRNAIQTEAPKLPPVLGIKDAQKKVAQEEVETLLADYVTKGRVIYWSLMLKDKNMDLNTTSLKKTMPIIVQDSLLELKIPIGDIVRAKAVSEKMVRKALKRILPKKIISIFKELREESPVIQEEKNG